MSDTFGLIDLTCFLRSVMGVDVPGISGVELSPVMSLTGLSLAIKVFCSELSLARCSTSSGCYPMLTLKASEPN